MRTDNKGGYVKTLENAQFYLRLPAMSRLARTYAAMMIENGRAANAVHSGAPDRSDIKVNYTGQHRSAGADCVAK